jgi:hypothetical protein
MSPALLVEPDVAIDGLVTDREDMEARKPAHDLLRAPVLAHEGLDRRPVRRVEVGVSARALEPAPRVPMGELGRWPLGGRSGVGELMPTRVRASSGSGIKPLVWLAVVVAGLVGLRFAPTTTVNPLDATAVDKTFHIGVRPLPSGWRAEWAKDEAAIRLVLSPSDGSAEVQVMAFKGDLDKERFSNIGSTIFGATFPPPKTDVNAREYGTDIRRTTYAENTMSGNPIYTTIDVLWQVAETKYAYVVVARSLRPEDQNVGLVKSSLAFSPPRLNLWGRVGAAFGAGFEFLESGETWFAILTWIAATGWGIWFG